MDEIARLARPEILAMTAYSSARREGEQTRMEVFLDANESPFPPFPGGADEVGLNRYPEPQPAHLLDRFAEQFGAPRERLLITRGADEAIDLVVRAFCSAGRDGIVICPPTFGMYEISAQVQGARIRAVNLIADSGFQLDPERIAAAVETDSGLKVVFVCTPNNPTGNLLRRVDVLRLAERLLGRALIVADQTYVEYSGEAPLSSEIDAHPNLVVLRTLSKEYGLAGERVGITIAHPEVIGILGRILAPYPLTQSSIRAVSAAMSPPGVAYAHGNIACLIKERMRVAEAIGAMSHARVHASDANFLLVEVGEPRALVLSMARAGIKIRDRSTVPGIEGSVRIGIGTAEQNDAVLALLAEHGELHTGKRPTGRRRPALATRPGMREPGDMSNPSHTPTTISNIGVAMFTIADQDAAIAYYTKTLGWELRADVPFGDEGGNRWVEVAPRGSTARLALNPPMGEWGPGGSAVGVETPDVDAEHARLQAIEGVRVGDVMGGEGPVPRMFSIEDPDGNHIWVVQSA